MGEGIHSSNEIEMELKQKLLCLRLALGRLCLPRAGLGHLAASGREGSKWNVCQYIDWIMVYILTNNSKGTRHVEGEVARAAPAPSCLCHASPLEETLPRGASRRICRIGKCKVWGAGQKRRRRRKRASMRTSKGISSASSMQSSSQDENVVADEQQEGRVE